MLIKEMGSKNKWDVEDEDYIVSNHMSVPERNLWASVINRAITDIETYLIDETRNKEKYFYAKGARQWIHWDSLDFRSFSWCCEVVFSVNGKGAESIIKNRYMEEIPRPFDFDAI